VVNDTRSSGLEMLKGGRLTRSHDRGRRPRGKLVPVVQLFYTAAGSSRELLSLTPNQGILDSTEFFLLSFREKW
jgi:hypothetical protein